MELRPGNAGLKGVKHDQRLKTQRYRHQPILRVHIPKERNKTRPIGISCIEDKLVQGAVKEVLQAVYEPIFRESSYGFRPHRRAHDALRALDGALMRGEVNWILEADIQTFFDSLDRKKLMEMLRERIADKALLRLIGKCLRAGILDGEEYSEPDEGTVQGSSLKSPCPDLARGRWYRKGTDLLYETAPPDPPTTRSARELKHIVRGGGAKGGSNSTKTPR